MRTNYSRVRAVTFDVGGTLIQPWPSVGHIYAEVARRYGCIATPDVLNHRFTAAWKTRQGFTHQRDQWQALVNETFAGLLPGPPSNAFFADLYDRFARAAAWRVFDDVVPTLTELRERGFKLAVLSNWDERLRPLLKELGLNSFNAFIISIEVGRPKPDKRMFEAAAAHLGIGMDAILHVGDTSEEDLAGAVAAGCQALLLDRRSTGSTASGAITSLAQVPLLLEKPLHNKI